LRLSEKRKETKLTSPVKVWKQQEKQYVNVGHVRACLKKENKHCYEHSIFQIHSRKLLLYKTRIFQLPWHVSLFARTWCIV
jgi:hypothetical protein